MNYNEYKEIHEKYINSVRCDLSETVDGSPDLQSKTSEKTIYPSKDDILAAADYLGFQYDSDQDIFYSKIDPLQRYFGYSSLYDEMSPLFGMIFHSEPIIFEYDNQDWMLEFWKGQYGIFTGGEMGLYIKEAKTDTPIQIINDIANAFDLGFYSACSSDEDQLNMSFSLIKDDKIILKRDEKHWWLTGFKLGVSKPSELIMDINIEMKDEKMRDAFIDGLINVGYLENQIAIHCNCISFRYDKPHTEQSWINKQLLKIIGK